MIHPVIMKAIYQQRNVFRFYEIHMTKDLFGMFSTTIYYGRIGCHRGTKKEYVFEDQHMQKNHAKRLIKKRLSAKKRIGTNYQIVKRKLHLLQR